MREKREPRKTQMLIRLRPDEKERFRRAAERDGLALSPWIRSMAVRRAAALERLHG